MPLQGEVAPARAYSKVAEGNGAVTRRYPIGAEVTGDRRTHFRVWAPKAGRIEVVIEKATAADELMAEGDGYFSGLVECGAGTLYRFRVNGGRELRPDPASRFQPQGVHGPSCVIDPGTFEWTDHDWRGVTMRGQVLYEMHVGTFTREGTWRAAMRELPELARIGITTIEMMPVADFAGNFGWGYDGVDLFAPARVYGTPDDLRAFINEAHSLGLGVILDVVYNHLGPEGNYLRDFADDYFTTRYDNEWGDPLNFDGPNSGAVREFFITNARYWIEEFHFDGFRFDATQQIFDMSANYIVAEIGRAARDAAGERSIILIAENEPQHTRLVRPENAGGYGLDALWNDDWHHSAIVALTGRDEAYYSDHGGTPQEFISAAKFGYLFQGQHYRWQDQPRGTPAFDISPEKFVTFIENHDQVANCASGCRVRTQTSPGRYRAMTALMLLGPATPLLFQGEEFGSLSPFTYFNDSSEGFREAIQKGRFKFLAQFPSVAGAATQSQLPIPSRRETYEGCKLDFRERETQREIYELHRDLLRLRREDARFSEQGMRGLDGAVLNDDAFVLRFFSDANDDRLVVVNLGRRTVLRRIPEPLLAPPRGMQWQALWTSELPKYGGPGAAEVVTDQGWILPAEAAVVLRPIAAEA